MKENKKVNSIICGIVFLFLAFGAMASSIGLYPYDDLTGIGRIDLALSLCGFLIMSVMGVLALRQMNRSKVLNAMAIVFLVCRIAYYIVVGIKYEVNPDLMASNLMKAYFLVFFIGAFVLSQKAGRDSGTKIDDSASEAVKMQAQEKMQTEIYWKQMQNGILAQEEYDQIIKNMHQVRAWTMQLTKDV